MSKVDHVIKSKTRFKYVEQDLERFQKRMAIIFARGGLKDRPKFAQNMDCLQNKCLTFFNHNIGEKKYIPSSFTHCCYLRATGMYCHQGNLTLKSIEEPPLSVVYQH